MGAVDRISRLPIRSTILVAIAALATTALVLASSGNSALAASSVVNGNFETGDLSGWSVDTTGSGETASAVTDYTVRDYFQYCEWACPPNYLHVSPHEGSYFALLKVADQSQWTTISQPFTASNGDRISGWVFTLETLYQTRGFTTPGFEDKGQVVLTDGSGTTVATLFKDSGSSGDYNSPWRYWEYTFTNLTGEGQFQIQAKQSSQMWSISPDTFVWEPNVLGLDDVKISTLTPDTTKPSTSATRLVEPNATGWNNTDVTVKLKATDNDGGWGLKELTYRIDGGEPITKQGDQVSSPIEVAVPITAEGENTLTYYATDKAGNVEEEQNLQVKIDKTPPKVDVNSISPADNATRVSPSAKISVTYLESGSGIKVSTLTDGFGLLRETRLPGGSIGSERVSGTVSYNAASKTATFTPRSKLIKGTYFAYTNELVKDKAGNSSDYRGWYFYVG